MIIDYRSDTVTKPTKEMLEAMFAAPVGDDVFGEDPSINELENMSAEMFGMAAALYCPSGTMTNQIAIKCHTQPGDEVICDASSHIYQYEGGGIAFNSAASVKLLNGNRGRITADQVAGAINAEDVHKARTSLVSLENTSNRGGGSCYDLEEIKKIRALCDQRKLSFHLDGARLFNALVATGQSAKDFGNVFHSISICLSKSLGCPVGSLIIGTKDLIRKSRRVRKAFGGGMRQAGYLAAAGIYALKNNIERLATDHEHAKRLGEALQKKDFVSELMPVETNIVIFSVKDRFTSDSLVSRLKEDKIYGYAISPTQVRLVTHFDLSQQMIQKTIDVIQAL
ncbi:MAG TPA: GntG family PLP-dependent aldolase [Flavisolibacter sp.]|nr:GntG family PLP-dependent aldolase [Flavisolibacter sp.]